MVVSLLENQFELFHKFDKSFFLNNIIYHVFMYIKYIADINLWSDTQHCVKDLTTYC